MGIKRKIGELLFKGWGWKLQGKVPYHIPKKLYVVIPHTSNWDFPVGILLKMYQGMEVGFVAKQSLFYWPYGWIFRGLGGIPVNRSKSKGFIDSIVEVINSRERFSTSIAPEGTRKKVKKLKSGFYHIAKKAKIPVIYIKFDWKNKIVDLSEPRFVAESYTEEEKFVINHFKGVVGAVPENSF
ncbi:MAG: 1-acyl-sn-glycerol-3-phosphate acyltransferase [Saprospiraceae bacterium]